MQFRNKVIRKILFKIIKNCPLNYLRKIIYRRFFNYSIGENVYIGKSVINCNQFSIEANAYIGDNNFISSKSVVRIGPGSKIISDNFIIGSSSFSLGKNSRIIQNHYLDLTNPISIGEHTWLAGRNSEIWTHGSTQTKLGLKDLGVTIGNHVYLGSSCLIAPGVKINNLNLIGLGSVVMQSIEGTSNIVIGNPAKITKTDFDWRRNW